MPEEQREWLNFNNMGVNQLLRLAETRLGGVVFFMLKAGEPYAPAAGSPARCENNVRHGIWMKLWKAADVVYSTDHLFDDSSNAAREE